MNMRFARTGLIATLLLVVILSVTGGTIAWFSDSVESTGNIIESGKLDLKLYAIDHKTLNDSANPVDWANDYKNYEIKNDSSALFNYKLWEPGYTDVKHIKIANDGNLAFKWHLKVKPAMSADAVATPDAIHEVFKLAKVIEVYLAPAGDYTSFADIQAAAKKLSNQGDAYKAPTLFELADASILGSTNNFVPDPDGVAYGVLLPSTETGSEATPAGSVDYVIALHMQESAGNEYQGLTVGDGFVLDLRAEQYTYEQDSFNDQYDADATVSDLPAVFHNQFSAEELATVSLVEYNGSLSDDTEKPDVGYLFATTDTPYTGVNSKYAKWHADFAVSFDKDIEGNVIGLAGTHTKWGSLDKWLGFDLTEAMISEATDGKNVLPANQPIRLLGEAAMVIVPDDIKQNFSVNYEELCSKIFQLRCGAYAMNAEKLAGTTMTVELRMYEVKDKAASTTNSWNEETGNYIVVDTFTHKF